MGFVLDERTSAFVNSQVVDSREISRRVEPEAMNPFTAKVASSKKLTMIFTRERVIEFQVIDVQSRISRHLAETER